MYSLGVNSTVPLFILSLFWGHRWGIARSLETSWPRSAWVPSWWISTWNNYILEDSSHIISEFQKQLESTKLWTFLVVLGGAFVVLAGSFEEQLDETSQTFAFQQHLRPRQVFVCGKDMTLMALLAEHLGDIICWSANLQQNKSVADLMNLWMPSTNRWELAVPRVSSKIGT